MSATYAAPPLTEGAFDNILNIQTITIQTTNQPITIKLTQHDVFTIRARHWPSPCHAAPPLTWIFMTGWCSGRGVQWMRVVSYDKLV